MPRCYLLALTAGSSLDQQSNNVSLFNLVEQVNVPTGSTPPALGHIPLEVHAYFHMDPHEMGREVEMRFAVVASSGLSLFTDPVRYRVPTPRFRTRGVGVPFPATFGHYELRVDFRLVGAEDWARDPIAYPISFLEAKNEKRVTH